MKVKIMSFYDKYDCEIDDEINNFIKKECRKINRYSNYC